MMRQVSFTLPGLAPVPVILATDSADPSGVGYHMITLARHLGTSFAPRLAFQRSASGQDFVTRACAAGLGADLVAQDNWADWMAHQSSPLLHVHAGIGWEGQTLVSAGRKAGMTVVRTEHLPWLIDDPAQQQDYCAMLRNLAQVIVVSPGAAPGWQQAMARMQHRVPLSAIPNGIVAHRLRLSRARQRHALGIGADQPFLLHVGRFTPQKAHNTKAH